MNNMMNDRAILQEVGRRLNRCRIDQGLTQARLASEAGVAKRTVERIEAGESAQTSNLVRILRVLGLLDAFVAALPESGPRPMELLRLHGKERRRASSKRSRDSGDSWQWGDGE
ncbi:helix-turn-helix domain-containing protein [Geothermobacter hydrogeniphilus]|uniref:Transcriptional regulator n=1 Tax=Geothermobacter hydrogeniphilus TaxID=1969733 RepID=A0A1X0XLE2_9BACT|nr:helix-turn-helix transcriptional regulator [Geothermobacter hydrogeniphilus]ORJ53671.1 transcriptional regulator [Geothermobacter hydrogeniphilus]